MGIDTLIASILLKLCAVMVPWLIRTEVDSFALQQLNFL